MQYFINYFGQKTVGYFGDEEGAIRYAESFASNLILGYDGDIEITDADGRLVAKQTWVVQEDRSSVPTDWEVLR